MKVGIEIKAPAEKISKIRDRLRPWGPLLIITILFLNAGFLISADVAMAATCTPPTQYMITVNQSPGGNIIPSGDVDGELCVNNNADQTFTITPDPGYEIDSITTDGILQPVAPSYTFVSVRNDHWITANFTPIEYSLSINIAGGFGNGTVVKVPDQATYFYGDIVSLSANPGTGEVFDNWNGPNAGEVSPNVVASNVTIVIDSDKILQANFQKMPVTLTIQMSGTGTGTTVPPGPTQPYLWGDVVTLTATPDISSVFSSWSGNVVGNQVTMTGDQTITATFTLKTFTITASVNPGNGTISSGGTQIVDYGSDSTDFTMTPDPCYHVQDVIVDGTSVGAVTTYPAFTNVIADHTIEASFAPDAFTINANAGPGGSISPSGVTTVYCHEDQLYTITPDTAGGYNSVKDVVVDGVSLGVGIGVYTLSDLTADHTISATFEDHGDSCGNATAVSLNSSPNGTIDINGDEDFYRIDVPAPGGTLTIYTEYTADRIDTYGHLLDSTCSEIAQNDDGGHQSNFQIIQTPAPGTYYIRVRNYWPDQTGTYILHIEYEADDHGSDLAGATPVTCGSTTVGRIYPAGNWDYFRLDLSNPGLITINSGGNTDTYGYLLDSGGNEIQHDNDSGTASNFFIERMLDAGTYYIAVQHYNASQTGDYSLEVQCSLSYTLTATAQYGGTISPAGTIIVSEGGSQTFMIVPNSGNNLLDVLVDDVSVGALNTYTFTNITSDHTIIATFNVPPEACVDLADVPLDVKRHGAPANIMFVLDDSGTMDWEFMTTQDNGVFTVGHTDYEYLWDLADKMYKTGNKSSVLSGPDRLNWKSQWAGINKTYYNPRIDYTPWPTLTDADPDTPRSFPTESTPTLDLSNTYHSFDAGAASKIIDNQDSGFSMGTMAVIVDDVDPGFWQSTIGGIWSGGILSEAYNNYAFETAMPGNYTASWTPNLPTTGQYAVYARWQAETSRSTVVPYTINHSAGSDIITVDQRSNGGEWVLLGTYNFDQGSSGNVTLSAAVSDNSLDSLCADAVRFVLTDGWNWATDSDAYNNHYFWTAKDGTYTVTWTPNTTAGDYLVYAKWVHNSTRSQTVPYTINHSGGSDTIVVDQRQDDGDWYLLGTYSFDTGSGDVSMTYTRNGANDTVCADAVRFVPITSSIIDIKNAHYYVRSALENKPYLVVVDGGTIRYWEVTDDGDDLIEAGELWETTSPPADVSSHRTYTEERQNFANWFQYYRKRDLLSRYAVANVITKMQGVQIGIRGINGVLVQPVLKVKVGGEDYTSILLQGLYAYRLDAHRAATPLRQGLEEVGRYFDQDDGFDGGVGPSPIATNEEGGSCQQNFAVAFTDSYYNGLPPHVSNADGDNGLPHADSEPNTLADVAMYYYENDLADNVDNQVPVNPADDAVHQHMVTYGVTFGVYGTMNPDDYDLENCTVGTCPPWPVPITALNDKRFKIDDLWHATVNGRGTFMMTSDPEELVAAFLAVMQNIESRIGSAASVSVNGDELYGVLDDNVRMYQSSYSSDGWIGDVKAYELDHVTGDVITTSYVFSAAEQLENLAPDNRIIATYDGATVGIPFRSDSLTTVQKDFLVEGGETDYIAAENRLNYLRGDPTNEVKYGGVFRSRYQRLGDIVHSSPVFENGVLYAGGNDGMMHAFSASDGRELFAYVPNLVFENLKELTRPNYSHRFFVDLSPSIRRGVKKPDNTEITVLVGGLGKGGTGYYALDITDPPAITNEFFLAQRVLWEFPRASTDPVDIADMGYSYSKPSIVKSNDADRWVVIFGNGYNSINSHAVLFILDPVSGDLIKKIDTGVGSCNGLSTPVAVDGNGDNTVDYVYAGDLKGNLWKFNLTGNISDWEVAYHESGAPRPLFQAKDGLMSQPITTKPDVMFHCEKNGFVVVFGTGRYLGDTDLGYIQLQTIYGIWDYGDVNDPSEYLGSFERGSIPQLSNQPALVTLMQQTLMPGNYVALNGQTLRVLTANAANWETTKLNLTGSCNPVSGAGGPDCDPNGLGVNPDPVNHAGWYFDLPLAGERVPGDPMIRDKKAIVISFIPEQTPCGTGGDSYVMEMDACSGGRLTEAQFDINNDGKVDDNDLIALTDADGNPILDGDGNPIMVAPTGIFYPGRLHPPAILKTGNEEIKYFSTNVGSVVTLREKGVPMGIIYWMEVIPQ